MMGSPVGSKPLNQLLHDHHSLELNAGGHDRVCQIPRRKFGPFTSKVANSGIVPLGIYLVFEYAWTTGLSGILMSLGFTSNVGSLW